LSAAAAARAVGVEAGRESSEEGLLMRGEMEKLKLGLERTTNWRSVKENVNLPRAWGAPRMTPKAGKGMPFFRPTPR
jgi:hypothetical protein